MKYMCLIMTCWVLVVMSAGCASFSRKGRDRVPHRSKHYSQFQKAASRPKGVIPMPNRDESSGDVGAMLAERYAFYSQPKPPVITKVPPQSEEQTAKPGAKDSPQPEIELTRKVHIRFDDDADAKQFIALAANKMKSAEDAQFVAQLFKETEAQRQSVLTALHSQYGIEPDRDYRYDSSSRTIYALSAHGSKKAQGVGSVHRRLTDAAAAKQFVGLAARRQELSRQLVGLQRLYEEKMSALKQANQQLVDSYQIKADRQYQYEAATDRKSVV